jgi:bacterioferritin-associated ferredoxin
MFVCICNAVTDRQIRSQAECCRGTVAQVYRALGAKVQCGKCVPVAKSIINGLRPQARDDVSMPDFDGLQLPARHPASIPAFAMAD